MPKTTLRMAYKDFFGYYDMKPYVLVRGQNSFDDCLSAQLPRYIAKVFEVSNRAATIRLEKLGAITGKFKQQGRPA